MMLRRTLISLALLGACALPTASADVPEQAFYVGVFGGAHLVLDDWDLSEVGDRGIGVDHGFIGGVRLGGHVTWWLGIEAGLGVLPVSADDPGGSNVALNYSADLNFHLIRGNWVPVVNVGAGGYHNVDGALGDDADYDLHYGLGVKGMLTDWLALRVDVRHHITDGFEGDRNESLFANNLEVTAGLDFMLVRSADDRDGDSIADARDRCPTVPGSESAEGCPDADGDSIADADDECPQVPGHRSAAGCPDRDGDSVVDDADGCPDTPGQVAHQGCPDSDGDNIVDSKDACPKLAGVASAQGCPDSDGDSLRDSEDVCPTEAGPVALKGCPDSDGDGVSDREDRCPKTPGVIEEQGCLPKAVAEKFSGTLEGIYFATGSARIKQASFPVLDEAANILTRYPTVRVRISGHTDNRGADAKNMTLSQERAKSVAAYLVQRGIDEKRLEAVGFGETRPIGPNTTKQGRAMNRRIEFEVIR